MSRPEVLRQRDRWAEAVWRSTLPAADKVVALAYADHARDGLGAVWVTVERLMERTSLSRSGAMKCLNRLKAAGWIAVAEPSRQHRSTRYRLLLPDGDLVEEEDVAGASKKLENQASTSWTDGESTGWTSDPVSSPPGAPSGPRGEPSGAPGGPDLSTHLSSPSMRAREIGRLPAPEVEAAARVAGVPADVLPEVVALALADTSTRISPSGRLRGDAGYAQRLVAQARADRAREAEALVRTATHHGQPECEHGTPGGASLLPSTGRPVCALCRRGRGRQSHQPPAPNC